MAYLGNVSLKAPETGRRELWGAFGDFERTHRLIPLWGTSLERTSVLEIRVPYCQNVEIRKGTPDESMGELAGYTLRDLVFKGSYAWTIVAVKPNLDLFWPIHSGVRFVQIRLGAG